MAQTAADVAALMLASRDVAAEQTRCCELLCDMSASDLADGADAVSAVLTALRLHLTCPDVAQCGCAALAYLVRNSVPNRSAADAVGAPRALVMAMRVHAGDAEVQLHGCEALGNIALSVDARRTSVAAAGALDVLVAAMQAHRDYAEVLTRACAAVAWIVETNAANGVAAGVAGAVEAVVAAMTTHPLCVDLQCCACSALMHLTCFQAPNKVTAGTAGAIDAVVAACRAHSTDLDVLIHGCSAFSFMVAENPINCARAIDAGAIELVIAASRAHLDDATLQRNCCSALGIFYQHQSNDSQRSNCFAGKAIAAVVAALGTHLEDANVQCQGCFALNVIARHAPTHAAALGGAPGGLQALTAAARAHPSDVNVQRKALLALGRACGDTDNVSSAVAGDVFAAAVGALRAHACVEDVCSAACSALCQVVGIGQSRIYLRVAADIEPLVAALHAYPTNLNLQRAGCCVLVCIISEEKGNATAKRAVATGAVEAVLAAMMTLTDADTYNGGCQALDALMRRSDTAAQRAVCAVAAIEDMLSPERGLVRSNRTEDAAVCARVRQLLRNAAAHHDLGSNACAVDGCKRCAAARAAGVMCAWPCCGARTRAGSAKKLLRCGTCRLACYCGANHQRLHWAEHRPACRTAAAAAAGLQQVPEVIM